MPPNKRRDRSRNNHLLDVSRSKSNRPTEGPAAQLLDQEQTPLSIIGRSRVVLDAEEYERLHDAAERSALGTSTAAENPADRASQRPADPVEQEPEVETPPAGESRERFVANIRQDTSTVLAPGDENQVDDHDPFEEFARLRRPKTSTAPIRTGSAALAAATTTPGRTRPDRTQRANGHRRARRLGPRGWAAVLISCAALAAISVLISEGHHEPRSQPVAAQTAARSGSLENLAATRAAMMQFVDAAIDKQRRADAARARKARAERSARARRRRLDLRRATERARQRAASSSDTHDASGTTSDSQAATNGTSEATATSSYTPTVPETTTPAAGASSGTTSTTTHTHPFGAGGILGAGHQG